MCVCVCVCIHTGGLGKLLHRSCRGSISKIDGLYAGGTRNGKGRASEKGVGGNLVGKYIKSEIKIQDSLFMTN